MLQLALVIRRLLVQEMPPLLESWLLLLPRLRPQVQETRKRRKSPLEQSSLKWLLAQCCVPLWQGLHTQSAPARTLLSAPVKLEWWTSLLVQQVHS